MEHSSAGTMNGSAKRGAGDSAINTPPEHKWPQRPWRFTGENEASVWGRGAQVTPQPREAGLLGWGPGQRQILELLTCAHSLARGPTTPTLPFSRARKARRSL